MNCLLYLTDNINENNAEYIDYTKKKLSHIMDMYVICPNENISNLKLSHNIIKCNTQNISDVISNNVLLKDYEHYLVMRNGILFDGDLYLFFSKINKSECDYMHIGFNYECELLDTDLLYYISKTYINHNTGVVKLFENLGYNFFINIKNVNMLDLYLSNVVDNTFFGQINDLYKFKKPINKRNLRCVVTCPCKIENNYLREWVLHYYDLGFENAIIIDNNDVDGERCADVLLDYIREGFVIIYDFVGQNDFSRGFNEVYKKYKDEYDWFANFETDEYLYLENHSNINDFLAQSKFNNFDVILLCWLNYGDSGHVTVLNNDYNLQKRFTEVVHSNTLEDEQTKCIVRGHLPITYYILGPHLNIIDTHKVIKRCNSEGVAILEWYCYGAIFKPRTYTDAYIKHYRTKTIQEYIEHRIRRGIYYKVQTSKTHNINFFFLFNEKTPEKLEWIKNNYPDYLKQLGEPYNLEDYYENDVKPKIYDY